MKTATATEQQHPKMADYLLCCDAYRQTQQNFTGKIRDERLWLIREKADEVRNSILANYEAAAK